MHLNRSQQLEPRDTTLGYMRRLVNISEDRCAAPRRATFEGLLVLDKKKAQYHGYAIICFAIICSAVRIVAHAHYS